MLLTAITHLNAMYSNRKYLQSACKVLIENNKLNPEVMNQDNFSFGYDGYSIVIYNRQTKQVKKVKVPEENSTLDNAIIVRFLEDMLNYQKDKI